MSVGWALGLCNRKSLRLAASPSHTRASTLNPHSSNLETASHTGSYIRGPVRSEQGNCAYANSNELKSPFTNNTSMDVAGLSASDSPVFSAQEHSSAC